MDGSLSSTPGIVPRPASSPQERGKRRNLRSAQLFISLILAILTGRRRAATVISKRSYPPSFPPERLHVQVAEPCPTRLAEFDCHFASRGMARLARTARRRHVAGNQHSPPLEQDRRAP